MRSLRSSGSVGGVVRPSAGRPYPGSNQPCNAPAFNRTVALRDAWAKQSR